MPVTKCKNGKWKIGNGKCMYTSKAKANKAYKAYLAKKQDGGYAQEPFRPVKMQRGGEVGSPETHVLGYTPYNNVIPYQLESNIEDNERAAELYKKILSGSVNIPSMIVQAGEDSPETTDILVPLLDLLTDEIGEEEILKQDFNKWRNTPILAYEYAKKKIKNFDTKYKERVKDSLDSSENALSRFREQLETYTSDHPLEAFDKTFTKEFERAGKRALKRYFGTDPIYHEVEPGQIEDVIGRIPKGSNVVFMDHSGDNLFGIPDEDFFKLLGSTDPEVCIGGTCHGADRYKQILEQAMPNSDLLFTKKKWEGFDLSKKGKGMLGMKKGGEVKQQLGYSDGSPFVNENSIRIQGNTIDMSNTGIPLLLQGDNGVLSMAMPYSGLHTIEGANSITEIPLNTKTTNMKNKKSKKSSTKAKRPLVQDSLPTYQLGGLFGSLVGGLLGGGGAGSMQGFGGSPIASGGPLGGLLGAMGGSGGIMGGAGILGSVFGGGLGSLLGGGQAGTINPNYAGNVDPSQVTGFGSLVKQLGNQQPQPDPNLVSYLQTQGSTGPGSLFQQLQTQGSTGPGSLTGTGQQLPFGNLMDLAGQFRQGQQLSQRQSGNVDPLRDLDAYRVNPTRGFLAFQMGGDVEDEISAMSEVQKISEISTEHPNPSFFTLPQDALSQVKKAQRGGFAEDDNAYLQVLDFESAAPMTPGKFEKTFNNIGKMLKKEDPEVYKGLKEEVKKEIKRRKENKELWMDNLYEAAVLQENFPNVQRENTATQIPTASYDEGMVRDFENWKKEQLDMLNSQEFWMETVNKYGPEKAPEIKRRLIHEVKSKQMPNALSYQQGGFANLLFPGGVNVDTMNQTPSNLPGGSGGNYSISLAQLLQPNIPFGPASRADYSFKTGGYVTRNISDIKEDESISTFVIDPSYASIIEEYDFNFKKGGSVSKDCVHVPIQFGEGGPVKMVSVEKAGLGKFFKKIGKGIKKVGKKLWEGTKASLDFGLSNLGIPNAIDSAVDDSKFLSGFSSVLGKVTPAVANALLPGAGTALKGLQGLNIGGGSGGGGQQGGQLPSFGGFGQGIQPGGLLGGGLGGMNPSNFGFGDMGGYGMPQNQGFNFSQTFGNPFSFSFQEGGFVEQPPLMPIQTEKGEKIIHPDLSITDVNAKKKHSQMDDDLVTDIVREGSFIASADKDMKISREDAEEILLAIKNVPYKEIKKGKIPEEITLADLWTDSMPKKVTIAELVQRVKEKYPTVDWEDNMDIFDKITNEQNVNSRMPWLEALSAIGEGMKEENPSIYDFKKGGKVKHIKKGVPMYQMGGDILGVIGSALPMLGGLFGGGKNQNQFQTDPATRAMMMGSFPISTAGQLKQLRAMQGAGDRALNNFGDLQNNLQGLNQAGLATGLGTSLLSRFATDTDVTAPTVRNSYIRTMNTQTPRSFIDAAGTPALDATSLVQQLGTQGSAGAIANLNSQTIGARNQQAANQFNQDRQLDLLRRQTLDQGINQQSLYDAQALNKERGLRNAANQGMFEGMGSSLQGYFGNEASRANQAFGTGTQLDMYRSGLEGQGAQIVGNQMFNAANAANTLDLQEQMANLQGQQYNQQQGMMDQLLGQLGGGMGGGPFSSMFPNIMGGGGQWQGALNNIFGGGGGPGIDQSPLYTGGGQGGGILDGLNTSGAGLNLSNIDLSSIFGG